MLSKFIATVSSDCAACGCCVKVCPRQAITILHGMYAKVDEIQCIGCGKCVLECPGGLIQKTERSQI